jgi:murein DD-endopeptidase MepM/ murein hydrolase activator NlpD
MKALVGGGLGVVMGLVVLIGMFGGAKASQCADASFASSGSASDPTSIEALEIAKRVFDVGRKMHVPYPKFILAAFATVIVEAGGNTTMANPDHGDRTSVGAFQQQDFSPWTDNSRNRMSIRDAATTFYEQAIKKHKSGMSIGQLAQAVQVSAHPDKYDVVVPRARHFLKLVQKDDVEGHRAGTVFGSPIGKVDPTSAGQEKLIMPVAGPVVSPFGMRWGRLHAGIDIASPAGTPIKAAASGIITLQGPVSGYGNYTCIRHNPRLTTCYAHQSRHGRYSTGNGIAQGKILGYVGCTGRCFGDHLHFETRTGPSSNSTPVDPATYLGEQIAASGEGGTAAGGDPQCAEIAAPETAGGASFAWPTKGGKVIGGSNQPGSSHDPGLGLGGWQSDNALDISVPSGTEIYAADDGRISPGASIFGDSGKGGAQQGMRFTLEVDDNRLFYHHLSRIAPGIRPGKRVRRAQLLGWSGKANGVEHLHIAVENGRPEILFGLESKAER